MPKAPNITNIWQALMDVAAEPSMPDTILSGADGTAFSYPALVGAAQHLAGVIASRTAQISTEEKPIGLMLPNVPATITGFFALQSLGRVVAMINFNAGVANVLASCQTAQLDCVITSHRFIEAAGLALLVEAMVNQGLSLLYLEDLLSAQASSPEGWSGADRKPEDPALILFTSGSEGAPKGVVLSHRNVLWNIRQFHELVSFVPHDVMFGCLPLYHSFGLTVGALLPLLSGMKLFLYPSPLHYHEIPQAIHTQKATIILSTSTFLAGYARCGDAQTFDSLLLIVAGAEKLKKEVRALWREQFGKEIIEGYGVTETAPVISVNPPSALREGSVGFLLPEMEARLEPIEGMDRGGMLWVRGPNVMLGYLQADKPGTLIAPKDGWYETGDVVSQDSEGYLFIEGRMKRFAKIGGEMISLASVEAAIASLWPEGDHLVLSLPHPRKGERLVLMTDDMRASLDILRLNMRRAGLPSLAVPAEIMRVMQLPLLSSGKIDYVRARQWAETASGDSAQQPKNQQQSRRA